MNGLALHVVQYHVISKLEYEVMLEKIVYDYMRVYSMKRPHMLHFIFTIFFQVIVMVRVQYYMSTV